MRILSMTATFGKLDHRTLNLQEGLNIIEAPNEWGKSTWCAFLVAMLYGIETRVHSTKSALADKERYAPWSGVPMSGRMDIVWNGKKITLERSSKGRSVFGIFHAYETETGLPVPELTADNCGQTLLGVEKEVFLRAGFLKLTDMPVTPDKALRRRLNDLVTTGDESGAGDTLAQTLKDLKNRCRFNKLGLLPQTEAQRDDLVQKLDTLRTLHDQSQAIQSRQKELELRIEQLNNHQAALAYQENQIYHQKYAAAKIARDNAKAHLATIEADCKDLPTQEEIVRTLTQLQNLRDRRDALHTQAQLLPAAPATPEVSSVFRGMSAEEAMNNAQQDLAAYETLISAQKRPSPVIGILGLVALIAGIGLVLARQMLPGGILGVSGLFLTAFGFMTYQNRKALNEKHQQSAEFLCNRYRPLLPRQWIPAAEDYAKIQSDFRRAQSQYRDDRAALDKQLNELHTEIDRLTGGRSLSEWEAVWKSHQESLHNLTQAHSEYLRAEEVVQALSASGNEAPPPQMPDNLAYTASETDRLLSECRLEQQQLHVKLGQCLGQMDALGQESSLQQQLTAIQARIGKLEDTYAALTIAQQTLEKASNELQRRFAPRISQEAQALFARLTANRYNRLTLDQELSLSVATQEEDTLRSSLWRSDGTVDQLYLALRLGVAKELTPDAPMVLDDALVRFDGTRLAAALEILAETAREKQILLFTCQNRESAWQKNV